MCVDLSIGKDVPQGLKPSIAGGFMARLKAVPFVKGLLHGAAEAVPFTEFFVLSKTP